MPAIAIEDNPTETLVDLPVDQIPGPWCVVMTKSRKEKQLAHHLAATQVPYFLPMIQQISQSRNRFLIPLFNGILFIAAPINRPSRVGLNDSIKTALDPRQGAPQHTVFSFLHTNDQKQLKSELTLIASESTQRRTLKTLSPDDLALYKAGRRVEIVSPHSCAGLHGTIIKPAKSANPEGEPRFAISLSFLGQVVSMEIDALFLR